MKFFRPFLLTSLTLVFITISVYGAEEKNMQAKVYLDTKVEWLQLKKMHLDEAYQGSNYIEIITDQNELDRLGALGFRTEVVFSDLTAHYQSRLLAKARTMGGYKTLDEINYYIDTLVANHSDIVSAKVSIGTTIEGRSTWAIKISDNPNTDEEETRVLYYAAIHAREVITPEILIYFVNYLISNYGTDPTITDLVDNRELWIIPVANPDGYRYNQTLKPSGGGMWRKNRRDNGDGSFGIDLNRNFGYEWGYDDIGSSGVGSDETYRGTAAFSEPETQNLRDFILGHNFVITISYHSYSNLILWPWGYETIYTPDDDIFSEMGDTAASFNGYTPTVSWGLYVTNGDTDDWGYGEQTLKNKNFALTLEVGGNSDGFWPPTNRISTLVSQNLGPNLFFARIAADIYSLRAPGKPILLVADTVIRDNYNIDWAHHDTLNPAIQYELMELQNKNITIDSAFNFNLWTNNQFILVSENYHSSPTGFYAISANSSVRYIQTAYPHTVVTGDSLKFWTNYDIETGYDYAYVEISTDGENFTPIEGNITTNDDPSGANRGNGITGTSAGWVQGLFNLAAFVGQNVYYRLSYYTDSYTLGDGFFVDDISPVDGFGTSTVISSGIVDTTYNFIHKPAGDYYYKVRAQDAQNQWGKFSEIAATYAKSSFVCGDANGDTHVDLLDILFLISAVFQEGEDPVPYAAGDIDNSGRIDLLDILLLISYKYKAGDPPNCL